MKSCMSLRTDRAFSVPSLLLDLFDAHSRIDILPTVSSVCIPSCCERRLNDLWRPVARQSQFYEAVEVVQYYGIPKYGCSPVSVDAPLQFRMRFSDL
jgi:hypothetical protein